MRGALRVHKVGGENYTSTFLHAGRLFRDQPVRAAQGEIVLRPLEEDQYAVLELHEIHQMNEQPGQIT
jgi:hypothetical protein